MKKEAEEICNTRSRCDGGVPSPNPALPKPIEGKLYKVTQTQDACAIEEPTSEPVGTYKLSYIESYQHKDDKIRVEIKAKSVNEKDKPIKIESSEFDYYGSCSNGENIVGSGGISQSAGNISILKDLPMSSLFRRDSNEQLFSINLTTTEAFKNATTTEDSIISPLINLTPFYDYNQKVTANP